MAYADLKESIKVAFASGSQDLIPGLVERMKAIRPELPLWVVSESPPPEGRWIPYHPAWSARENFALCRSKFRGKRIRFTAAILQPHAPYGWMRTMAFWFSPWRFWVFNENLDHFRLHPRCAGAILRHLAWRARTSLRLQTNPGGTLYTCLWRVRHPSAMRRPMLHATARLVGGLIQLWKALAAARPLPGPGGPVLRGISVVIPSRDGKGLLARLLPGLKRELAGTPAEIIVVDNGSGDGTADYLRVEHPEVLFEYSARPLAFAEAANRGLARAKHSHVCLLNNDMTLEEGFFAPLVEAFDRVPELFAATAQIFFPQGIRREETGKAVMPAPHADDFPLRCDEPLAGENLSYVLYGSGGCTLYDTGKLRQLGGLDTIYQPAYVEDLDVGFRAWRLGWPTVYVEGARVIHAHRATTARYYSPDTLERVLEVNYLRFLVRAISSPALFGKLWGEALGRLNRKAARIAPPPSAMAALREAMGAVWWLQRPSGAPAVNEPLVLALGSGDVAVFQGQRASGRAVVLVASPYLPYPLSHGGAVRIFNLMRRAARDYDQVLVALVDELAEPAPELLDLCAEVVLVRRRGSHLRRASERPDEVDAFDVPAFHAAVRQTVRKWRPEVAQLEHTQMAQYAADCAPARTVLVEHDLTYDLCEQLLALGEDWEERRQWKRWRRFERDAWGRVDRVVTMSEKDRRTVSGPRAVCLPNGVDLQRFHPWEREPDPARVLFIGSFAHLPNVLAMEFYLREAWPAVAARGGTLHILAGARHAYYLEHHQDRAQIELTAPGIEVEDFVADVRPAYQRATVVIAPFVVSAGTNIKILEALAMGKAIVSTPAGIDGLDLVSGEDVVVAQRGEAFSAAILDLLDHPEKRRALERKARAIAERNFDWETTAGHQRRLYESLRAMMA